MKKQLLNFCVFMLVAVSYNLHAQDTAKDYFVGKWEILIKGTPGGDETSILVFKSTEDGKLTGEIITAGEPTEFTRVEEGEEEITAHFTSSNGYNVYMYLKKIDENTVEGTMMDMFEVSGKRIVE